MNRLETIKEQWGTLSPGARTAYVCLIVFCLVFFFWNHFRIQAAQEISDFKKKNAVGDVSGDKGVTVSKVMPQTNRNQGLEEISLRLKQLEEQVANPAKTPKESSPSQQPGQNLPAPAFVNSKPGAASDIQLDEALPERDAGSGKQSSEALPEPLVAPKEKPSHVPKPLLLPSEPDAAVAGDKKPGLSVPVNSAFEGVLLTGFFARQSSASGGSGAIGRVTSAVDVGTPFVSKIRGSAMLPNNYAITDLDGCWVSGSAIAVLSVERAYATADTLTCINQKKEIFEAKIKAYALDVDGNVGLSGHIVSKQGAALLRATLAGIASGIGQALSPTGIPAYNSSAASGDTQGYTLPNGGMVARTAIGQGVSNATAQISKFYLDYAKETFPVVEISSNTRITWVVKESFELRRLP